jgi:hypothetical protein
LLLFNLLFLFQATVINNNLCNNDPSCVAKVNAANAAIIEQQKKQFPPSPNIVVKPPTAKQKAKAAAKLKRVQTQKIPLTIKVCNIVTLGVKCETPKIKASAIVAAAAAASIPLPAGCAWVVNTSGGSDIVCTPGGPNSDPFVNFAGCKDTTGASGPCDLHLRPDVYTNAAIGRAECLPGIVDTDIEGNPRPSSDANHPPGMGCDIGAYQFTGGPPVQQAPPPRNLKVIP